MVISSSTQRKLGLISSYAFIMINTAVSVFLTPFMIRSLGDVEYGIYQMMASFAGYLLIINFGVGTIMARYVSLYLSKGNKKEEQNFIGLGMLITSLFAVIVIIASIILNINIGSIYQKSLTGQQIELASILFGFLCANIVATLFCQAYQGIISAYEHFVFNSLWNILRLILRVLAIVVILSLGYRSLAIVLVDFILSVFTLIVGAIYCHRNLHVKIKIYCLDTVLLKTVLLFSFALFLQTIVGQVNNSVGSFIVGLMIGPETVTLYSVAMTVFTMFSALSTATVSVYLPRATRMVAKGANGEELTDFIIQPSRVQTVISGSILFGFILFGNQFIRIWVGEQYTNAWLIATIIMIPTFLYYANGMVVTILDAMQKRMFRSLILLCVTGVNVLLTIILIKKYGYIGAPVSLALTTILGQIIIMNIYYAKVIRLNIIRMIKEIFSGILVCLIAVTVLCVPLSILNNGGIVSLMINIIIYLGLLIALLNKLGLTKKEKDLINNFIFKLKEKYI